jgi:hypothetical protein
MFWHERLGSDQTPAQEVGRILQSKREEHGLTRQILGELLITSIEDGDIAPVEALRWLAKTLELDQPEKDTVNDLLGLNVNKPTLEQLVSETLGSGRYSDPVLRIIRDFLKDVVNHAETRSVNSPRGVSVRK